MAIYMFLFFTFNLLLSCFLVETFLTTQIHTYPAYTLNVAFLRLNLLYVSNSSRKNNKMMDCKLLSPELKTYSERSCETHVRLMIQLTPSNLFIILSFHRDKKQLQVITKQNFWWYFLDVVMSWYFNQKIHF